MDSDWGSWLGLVAVILLSLIVLSMIVKEKPKQEEDQKAPQIEQVNWNITV
jgi:hypothetical protein